MDFKSIFKILSGDGTKLSGYVSAYENEPPRECGHCIFYQHDLCHHPVVMVDAEVPGKSGEPKSVQDEDCCNFFRSPKRVLMYAVRHGEDENDDLIGGWEDAPIDEAGEQDAMEAAEFLSNKSARQIICSDMKRTFETAKIISKELGITDISTDFRLRTWNKGYLNGAEKSEKNKEVLNSYKDNPKEVIPDGESHAQFEERHDEAFTYYVDESFKEGVKLLVLHNSGIKQLQRFCECSNMGNTKDLSSKNDSPDSVAPGGILKVTAVRGSLNCKVVLKERK
jgi:broad specificity phosphatase PhoE